MYKDAKFVRVEPTDLTIKSLQEIRDDVRGLREEQRGLREEQRGLREEQRGLREEQREIALRAEARFEAIETTLRDLAQQLVILARGIKMLIESRGTTSDRVDELERRLDSLEPRVAELERRPTPATPDK